MVPWTVKQAHDHFNLLHFHFYTSTFSRVFETMQGAKIKFSFLCCPDQLRIWSSGVSWVWGNFCLLRYFFNSSSMYVSVTQGLAFERLCLCAFEYVCTCLRVCMQAPRHHAVCVVVRGQPWELVLFFHLVWDRVLCYLPVSQVLTSPLPCCYRSVRIPGHAFHFTTWFLF